MQQVSEYPDEQVFAEVRDGSLNIKAMLKSSSCLILSFCYYSTVFFFFVNPKIMEFCGLQLSRVN